MFQISSKVSRRQKLAERFTAFLFSSLLLFPFHLSLWAAPTGEQVIHGEVSVGRNGLHTDITASNNSIIQWQGFDIAGNESVQFHQPTSQSRVLNRITGSENPTQILGSLTANGIVYLVNPAGVIFGENAFVNATQLYAAGGNISNENFLGNIDRFTGLTGDVINYGTLNGDFVALMGLHVANHGSIITPSGGVISMLSGDEVLIGEEGAYVFVNLGVPSETTETGVENTGELIATEGKVILGAGDLYSMAIDHEGLIVAAEARLEAVGTVKNSGTIDVSGESGGSAHTYGSEVIHTSTARVFANADEYGDGGRIVNIGTDNYIAEEGSIFEAKGGRSSGDGGYIEHSSYGDHWKISQAAGFSDVTATNGRTGLIRFDPTNVIIDATEAATIVTNLTGGNVQVDTFAAGADAGSITVDSSINSASSNDLSLLANDDIAVNASIDLGGGLLLEANSANGDTDVNSGDVSVDATINVGGDFTSRGINFTNTESISTAGGNIVLSEHTGNVTIDSSLNTSGGSIAAGVPTVSSIGGDFIISNQGELNTAGGNVDIAADGGVNIAGNITDAGAVDIQSDADASGAEIIEIATGSITADSDIRFRNNVDLQSNLVVDTTSGEGNVQFDGTVSGNENLQVAASGTVDFQDEVNLSSGDLDVSFDTNDNGAEVFQVDQLITANNIDISGGGTGTGDIVDVDQTLTATNNLTIDNVSEIDLAANVDLVATNGSVSAANNVALINLSGAGDNTITAGTSVDLADIDDSANIETLQINAGTDISVDAITLDNGGAGNLDINLGSNGIGALIASGELSADGNLTVDGTGMDDTATFQADVSGDNGITLQTLDTVRLEGDVDLTSSIGNIVANTDINQIDLTGAGSTNIIEATSGDINLGPITDSASVDELRLVGENITLASVNLDEAGNARLLNIDLDGSADDGARTLTAGAIQAGSLDIDGQGGDDAMNFNSTVETTVSDIDIATANTVDFDGDVTSSGSIIVSNADDIQLLSGNVLEAQGGNVDIITGIGLGISLEGAGTVAVRTTGADGDVRLAAVTSGSNESLDLDATGTVDLQGEVNLGGGDLDVSFDTNDNGTEVFQVDQLITANNVDISGGGTGAADIVDLDQTLTATNNLTIDNASEVDLAANVGLVATNGSVSAANNVALIDLSGAGDNTLTAGTSVDLADIDDSANIGTLQIDVGADISVDAITLDNGGAGNLDINLDVDANGTQTLIASGAIQTGSLDIDGQGGDDAMNFNSTVETTGGGIDIATADTISFSGDVTAETSLTANVGVGNVGLGTGVDLLAEAGAVTLGELTLSGDSASTNSITSQGGDNAITIGNTTAAPNDVNLTVTSDGEINYGTIDLNGGDLSMTIDANDDQAGEITLNIADTISSIGTLTLSGGSPSATGDIIDINADVTVAESIVLQNASEVDLAANVDLVATNGSVSAANNIATIDLSGAGDNTITAGTSVDLANIDDSANIGTLQIDADTDINVDAITLDNGGDGNLDINLGSNGIGALIASGELNVDGNLTVDGTGMDDTATFQADVSGDNGITLQTLDTVRLEGDVDLTSSTGNIVANTDINQIDLTGVGSTNIIEATSGDINLGPITDSASVDELRLVGENITLASVNLDDSGNAGLLNIDLDGGADDGARTLTVGAIQTGSLDIDGQGGDDAMNFNSTVETTVGGIDIATADTISFSEDVTAETSLTADVGVGNVDLGTGVDLLAEAGAVTLGELTLSGDSASTNSITSQGGDNAITIGNTTAAPNDVNLTVTSDGEINYGTIDLNGGDLSMTIDANDDQAGEITLSIADTISNIGTLTLSGGSPSATGDIIDINADVTVTESIVLQNASEVDLAANVDLVATNGFVSAANNVALIDLSGAGDNTITAGTSVDLADIDDSANIGTLQINAGTDISVDAITLDNGGASDLDINLGSNGIGALIASGELNVDGNLTVDGTGVDDTATFQADVSGDNGITLQTLDTVSLEGDVDLISSTGNIVANTDINQIDLTSVGSTNIIEATSGDINLGPITDSASVDELRLVGENITLVSVNLDDSGNARLLNIDLDGSADDGARTLTAGVIQTGSLTVDGIGVDDTATFQADVSVDNGITLQTLDTVNLEGGVDLISSSGDIIANTDINQIDLTGAGSTNIIEATSGDINLGPITDSASVDELRLVGENITLASVNLDNSGNARLLNIDLDGGVDEGARTLTAGAIQTGSLTVDGTGVDDTVTFQADVSVDNGITLQTLDTVSLAGDVDLTSSGGDIIANTDINQIDLTGVGSTNIIEATSGDIDLGPVTDSASVDELRLVGENITLASVNLDDSGNARLLNIDLDGSADGGVRALTAGAIQAGSLTVDGTGVDDTATFQADVSVDNGITLQTLDTVNLAGDVDLISSGGDIIANTDINQIDLTGADSTNIIEATSGDIDLGPVTDSASVDELQLVGENITLHSTVDIEGDQKYQYSNKLFISDNLTSDSGSIFFNATDLQGTSAIGRDGSVEADIPEEATIVLNSNIANPPDTLLIDANNFVMGQNEKLTLAVVQKTTALEINVPEGNAVLGDLNVNGDVTINSAKTVVLSRVSGPVSGSLEEGIIDSGVDFVGLDFDVKDNFELSNPGIQNEVFIGGDSINPQSVGNVRFVKQIPSISESLEDLNPNSDLIATGFDLIATGAARDSLANELSRALSATPEIELITKELSQDLIDALVRLGIYARSTTTEETVQGLRGYTILEQAIDRYPARPTDFEVCDARFEESKVLSVLDTYNRLVGEGEESRVRDIVEALGTSYDNYTRSVDNPTLRGYREYLETKGISASFSEILAARGLSGDAPDILPPDDLEILSSESKALHYLRGYQTLFNQIAELGLTEKEFDVSKNTLVRALRIPGIPPRDLLEIIENPAELLTMAP